MEFFTPEQSINFVLPYKVDLSDCNTLQDGNKKMVIYYYPTAQDLFQFSFEIADAAIVNDWAFLYIVEDGFFSSSGNTNLYYSLRKYQGDHRTVLTAPGHLFLKHEKHDLASFISVTVANSLFPAN